MHNGTAAAASADIEQITSVRLRLRKGMEPGIDKKPRTALAVVADRRGFRIEEGSPPE